MVLNRFLNFLKNQQTGPGPALGRFDVFSKNSKIDSELRKQFQVTKIGEWVDPIIVFDAPAYYGLFLHFYHKQLTFENAYN